MTPSKGYVHGSFGKRSGFTKPRGTAGGRRSTAPDAATSATSPKPSRPSRSPESFSSLPRPESGSASTEADELTTFERKITLLDRPADLPKPTDDVRDAALNGYRFVDVSAVKTLVSALLCPNCHGNELDLKESGAGASLQFVVVCRACGDIVTTPQSATVGKTRQSELAARLCVVGKDCGISFTKLKNLFGGMNAPSPMHLKTYQNTAEKVHEASMAAARDVMQEAATAVRGAQMFEDGEDHVNNADDLLDICASTGPKGFERILKKMGICPGSHHEEHTRKATQQKILKAKVKALDTSKTTQKRRKLEAIANEQKRIEEEGPTYGAGEF
ncbi:hypothetical protein HPB47_008607 [Ixodes persulcatus]|uniref:Uncharacterized protein n=1 Tax=Ixodes persulcatus TaxID=34615 RepID=A0AC60P4F1_IXOPE|nr:hypothetical protein HPB47_008607 [Ixodes persulcatus]